MYVTHRHVRRFSGSTAGIQTSLGFLKRLRIRVLLNLYWGSKLLIWDCIPALAASSILHKEWPAVNYIPMIITAGRIKSLCLEVLMTIYVEPLMLPKSVPRALPYMAVDKWSRPPARQCLQAHLSPTV